MSTPRDLLTVAMDMESSRPVEQGDLSLALAGAEAIELLAAEVIRLDGDHIVPGHQSALEDDLLAAAAAAVVREAPYESVADWLWRRGRGLSTSYQDALEAEGELLRPPRRGISRRSGPLVPADSPAHRQAVERWRSGEPVLALLAEALGGGSEGAEDPPEVTDDGVAAVLAAVNDALVELAAVRQRRSIENAAFDNIWRGGV